MRNEQSGLITSLASHCWRLLSFRGDWKSSNSSKTLGVGDCAWFGVETSRLAAEDAPEVTVEGIDPDGFDGQQGLVVDIELAATGGLSEAEPVGCLVSRAAKA